MKRTNFMDSISSNINVLLTNRDIRVIFDTKHKVPLELISFPIETIMTESGGGEIALSACLQDLRGED
ncbi:MAG: hypothetical protein ACYCZR_15895 [Burkholderiales bacterium]